MNQPETHPQQEPVAAAGLSRAAFNPSFPTSQRSDGPRQGRASPALPAAGMEQPPSLAVPDAAVSCCPAQPSPWLRGFRHGLVLHGAVPNPRRGSCPQQTRKLPSGPNAGRGREVSGTQLSDPAARGRSGGCCRTQPSDPGARGRSRGCCRTQPLDPGARGRSGGCCGAKPCWQQDCLCPLPISPTGTTLCQGLPKRRVLEAPNTHSSIGGSTDTKRYLRGVWPSTRCWRNAVDKAWAALFPCRNQQQALKGEQHAGGVGSEPCASTARLGNHSSGHHALR